MKKEEVSTQAELDKELAKIMQTGTRVEAERAFNQIRNRYKEQLFFFASQFFGKNTEDKEDVLQEAFLKIFQRINSYDFSTALSTWMYAITRNHMIDMKRKKRCEILPMEMYTKENEEGRELVYQFEDKSINTMDIVLKKERSNQLLEAVDSLKPSRKKIVLLFLEDKSYEDVSIELGLPLGTIKGTMFRAKEELKIVLTKRASDFEYGRVCAKKIKTSKEE